MRNIFGDLDVDSYKLSHYLQYPKGTTNISSYVTAREGTDEICFFGLNMWLKDVLDNETNSYDVENLRQFATAHGLPFNDDIYQLIHNPLPLRVQALPEGTIVRPGIPMVQVTNTDPRFPWLTSFVETSLLRAIWYPTTVATNSRECKRVIKHYMEKTCDDLSGLPFKLHDFGFRGVSSYESGCIGGLAHLVNFMGTDTMGALAYARRFYGEKMAGFSIPAAEHSTITSWGRNGEKAAYENMIDQFSNGLYAVVSDSYDIYNACESIWGSSLKGRVLKQKGTLVIRPDSGDPLVVVLRVLEILGERFGYTNNSRGYRVLPSYLRVIQGDGVNRKSIAAILGKMQVHGWSAENIAFGMGGALLQDVTRDDLSFAMKGSAASNDGGKTWTGFSKDPVTQSSKKSQAGRLAVIENTYGDLVSMQERDTISHLNLLQDTWVDDKLLIDPTLAEIRERAQV